MSVRMEPAVIVFIRAAGIRGKIQIMSDEKRINMSGNFVVCDVQEEYIEHLFGILSEQLPGAYQFYLFHDSEKMMEFIEQTETDVLLTCEEYREKIRYVPGIRKKFIFTENRKKHRDTGDIPIFRYQPAGKILSEIKNGIRESAQINVTAEIPVRKRPEGKSYPQKKGRERIRAEPEQIRARGRPQRNIMRDETQVRGIIGIYSPVHRIGKTRFAMRMGQKIAEKMPVLYLNLEGYSGGNHYFPEKTTHNLGDLIYCMKQERTDYGLKISSMTGQSGGMDYILPMENESDLRTIRGNEWLRLFEDILEKCIYEVLILDLGDCIDGLYEILRSCVRVYTPYIRESAAMAKMEQYEQNLIATGYGDVLSRTVKKQMQMRAREEERDEYMR